MKTGPFMELGNGGSPAFERSVRTQTASSPHSSLATLTGSKQFVRLESEYTLVFKGRVFLNSEAMLWGLSKMPRWRE